MAKGAPHRKRTRMDNSLEDPGHHAPDLQDRRPARARRQKPGRACRDALTVPLQGTRDHATADLGYPQSTIEPAAFHACFALRSNGASGFRDRLATLVRHPVE